MREQTIYVADDGSRWDTPEKAIEREALCAAVADAMSPMGEVPRDDGCNFANGHGYIQHDRETVESARWAIHSIAAKGPLANWFNEQVDVHGKTMEQLALRVSPSWHLRMLDGGPAPLCEAYRRFYCVDKQFREWGQPYYAAHPEEGEQFDVRTQSPG